MCYGFFNVHADVDGCYYTGVGEGWEGCKGTERVPVHKRLTRGETF